jgi:hypothetical protein
LIAPSRFRRRRVTISWLAKTSDWLDGQLRQPVECENYLLLGAMNSTGRTGWKVRVKEGRQEADMDRSEAEISTRE